MSFIFFQRYAGPISGSSNTFPTITNPGIFRSIAVLYSILSEHTTHKTPVQSVALLAKTAVPFLPSFCQKVRDKAKGLLK